MNEKLKEVDRQLANPKISWKRKNDLIKYRKRLLREIKHNAKCKQSNQRNYIKEPECDNSL